MALSSPTPVPPTAPVVVVAEDDDEMRRLMTRALRRDGYHVLAVADGVSLIAAVQALRADGREPDLVVSDVRMPRETGLGALAALRGAGSDVRVVLVSAFADEGTEAQAQRLGVAHVLSKPFDLDDLRTVALHVLRHEASSCPLPPASGAECPDAGLPIPPNGAPALARRVL